MIDVQVRSLKVFDFFRTADPEPTNLFVMLVRASIHTDDVGLCQRLSDDSHWTIQGDKFVGLLSEDEWRAIPPVE